MGTPLLPLDVPTSEMHGWLAKADADVPLTPELARAFRLAANWGFKQRPPESSP
jgi:hypothetical protein